jgi:hypothetical protein
MRMPDRSGSEHLSRYWSALVQGESPERLAALALRLDPAMLTIVHRMWSARIDAQPDPDFVQQLEEHLMNSTTLTHRPTRLSPTESSFANGQRTIRPVVDLPRVLRHRLSVVAAAILLAALGGITAFWLFDRGGDRTHTTGPAVHAPATASPTVELTDAALFDVVLPPEVLPTGAGRLAGLGYIYVESGATGNLADSCCPGLMFEHIVAGEITFTSMAAAQVLRADDSVEDIAAGVGVALQPGDTFIARNEVEFRAANTGGEPVQMVEWVYLSDPRANFGGHQLAGWGGPGGLDVTQELPDFPGAIEVRLQRLVLDPGEGSHTFRTSGLRQVVSPNIETDILTVYGDGGFTAFDSQGQQTTAYSIEITPSGQASAHPIVGVPAP